jgi:hypothetical protein
MYAICSTQVSSGCIIWPNTESINSDIMTRIIFPILERYKIVYSPHTYLTNELCARKLYHKGTIYVQNNASLFHLKKKNFL